MTHEETQYAIKAIEAEKEIALDREGNFKIHQILSSSIGFSCEGDPIGFTVPSRCELLVVNINDVWHDENIEVLLRYKDKKVKRVEFEEINTLKLEELLSDKLENGSFTHARYTSTVNELVEELQMEQRYIESRLEFESIDCINNLINNWNYKLTYLKDLENELTKKSEFESNIEGVKGLISLTKKIRKEGCL